MVGATNLRATQSRGCGRKPPTSWHWSAVGPMVVPFGQAAQHSCRRRAAARGCTIASDILQVEAQVTRHSSRPVASGPAGHTTHHAPQPIGQDIHRRSPGIASFVAATECISGLQILRAGWAPGVESSKAASELEDRCEGEACCPSAASPQLPPPRGHDAASLPASLAPLGVSCTHSLRHVIALSVALSTP